MTKNEVVVTADGLANILRKTKVCRKVGLTQRKALDMYKAGNKYYGRVEVVQNLRGQINVNYAKSVRNATGDESFTAAKRTWGVRVEGTPLVEHAGKSYIEVKCEGRPGKTTYFLDGVQVKDQTVIDEILSFKKKSRPEAVVIRDIPLINLLRLRMNKTTYRVKRV